MLGQLRLKGRDEPPILFVDRALAPEAVVVLGHFQHALAWHVSPTQNVLQERHYVFGSLRTTEGNNQDCVVVHAAFHSTQPNASAK